MEPYIFALILILLVLAVVIVMVKDIYNRRTREPDMDKIIPDSAKGIWSMFK